jgi:glutaredoxin-related protein
MGWPKLGTTTASADGSYLAADGHIIQNILARLTDRRTVPNILIHGASIGGSDDIHELHEKGELREMFETAGLKVQGNI